MFVRMRVYFNPTKLNKKLNHFKNLIFPQQKNKQIKILFEFYKIYIIKFHYQIKYNKN